MNTSVEQNSGSIAFWVTISVYLILNNIICWAYEQRGQ